MNFNKTIDWYNQNASYYATHTTDHQRNAEKFTKYLNGKKILDAGCGPGHDTDMFMRMGYDVTGMDISTGLLAVGRKTYPDAKFIEGDIRTLPFTDASFDGVWAQASLVHLETELDVKKALSEFTRVLKPEGILFLYVKKQLGKQKTAIVSDALSKHERFFRYFTEDELKKWFQKIGITYIESETQEDPHKRNEVAWIMMIGKKI